LARTEAFSGGVGRLGVAGALWGFRRPCGLLAGGCLGAATGAGDDEEDDDEEEEEEEDELSLDLQEIRPARSKK
jgi:hypothetical protein